MLLNGTANLSESNYSAFSAILWKCGYERTWLAARFLFYAQTPFVYSSSPWDPSMHSPCYGASSPRSCTAAGTGTSSLAVLPAHRFAHEDWWNATVNIVRPQPFQFGTQGVSHRLLHSACVWGVCQRNGRRQMIPLLCETAATHCSDSPGVTQQHLHQLQNTSPLSVPVSAGYLFLPPDPPQVDDNRAVCFSTGGWYRAGGSAFLLSICLGLWGVQNHSSITAAFSLCPKWLSPFLWGRLSLLVEICCLYQEQVHLHYRKALKEHNWALISICL